jgi:hypothetical protein
MSKQNILRITLFVSVLAFNPAVAQTNLRPVTTAASLQEQEEERLSVEISDALEAKGLEHEAAREITQLYVGKEIKKIERTVEAITASTRLRREEVIAYLSHEALFRKRPNLYSYDALVRMVSEITQRHPDTALLAQLRSIAEKNSTIA